MAELPRLRVGLSLDSATFVTETRKVGAAVDTMGRNVAAQNQQITAGFGAVSNAVSAARSALASLGVGLSVGAVTSFVKSTISWADALQELSERVDVSVEQIQRLQQAGELANVSQEQISNNLEQFAKRVGDAARDTGAFGKVLEESGIALRDQDGNLRSTTSIFEDYAARIATAASQQEALSLAVAGFGRSGAEMVTVLRDIGEATDKFNALSAEQVALLGKYDDEIGKVSQTLSFELKKGLVTSIAEMERIAAAFKAVVESAQQMAAGVDEAISGRLEGAMAGVAARTQGITDAFEAMYNAVVGQSYVPDMVTEIQGWMERLGGPAMVDPANEALTETERAFETAGQGLADTFSRAFENILQEGVTSFEDLADSVGRIFTNLTANLGQQFGDAIGASLGRFGAIFGGPLGSFGGAALGIGAMFGLQQLGGLFGLGGGPQSNRISPGGALGMAGRGGTGTGAQFIQGIDQQLIGLLDARSEAIVSGALAAARRPSVQYSKQPSANDLSVLAASRIGPAAAALGLSPGLIAGGRNQLTAEQQFANLQAAVGLMRTIEGFRIGPVATGFRDLNAEFDELYANATRLGLSTAELAQEHARLAKELDRQNLATKDALALSIAEPFQRLLDPLQEFSREITLGNLNPAGQVRAAEEEFRRIALLAMAGSTTAIQQLEGASRAFIAQSERFGASVGGVSARNTVQSVLESVEGSIRQAQQDAGKGVEDVIQRASQREVDTLKELIGEVRIVAAEIKRLYRQ